MSGAYGHQQQQQVQPQPQPEQQLQQQVQQQQAKLLYQIQQQQQVQQQQRILQQQQLPPQPQQHKPIDYYEVINSNTFQQENEHLFPIAEADLHKGYETSYVPENCEQGVLDTTGVIHSYEYSTNPFPLPYHHSQGYRPNFQTYPPNFEHSYNPTQHYQLQQQIQQQIQHQIQQNNLHQHQIQQETLRIQFHQQQPYTYEGDQQEQSFPLPPSMKTLSPILNPATLVLSQAVLKQTKKEESPEVTTPTKQANNIQIKDESEAKGEYFKDCDYQYFDAFLSEEDDDETNSDIERNSEVDAEAETEKDPQQQQTLDTLSIEPRKRGRRQKKLKRNPEEELLPPPSPRTLADPVLLQQYRQERNRRAAKRSRERKKEYIYRLEKECREKKSVIETMEKEMAKMKKELAKFKKDSEKAEKCKGNSTANKKL